VQCGKKEPAAKVAPSLDQRNMASMTAEQWVSQSLSYYQQNRYLESIAAAQTAVYLKPDYAEAYNNVGAGYAALHVWDAAIQADLQAIRLRPDFALARNNLNWALEQKRLAAR
jgi:tetratricopeptide (TPR) repeat protein